MALTGLPIIDGDNTMSLSSGLPDQKEKEDEEVHSLSSQRSADAKSKSKTPSIYHRQDKNNENNIDSPENAAMSKHLYRQKWWIFIHGIFLLTVSGISLPLLMQKAEILNEYYDSSQCCYCVWIGHNPNATHGRKLEFFPCVNYTDLKEYDSPSKVCNLDPTNTTYCAPFHKRPKASSLSWRDWERWKRTIFQPDDFSTTSSIAGLYKFHKYYPYYGIIGVVITTLYFAFLLFETFVSKKRLSVVLFVGNIVLTINCYYSYIKCYQYSKVQYDAKYVCNPEPPNLQHPRRCYQSSITPFLEFNLHLIVYFVSIYVVYPIVLLIMFWKCKDSDKCAYIQHKIETIFRNIGIFCGIYFVIISFSILLYIIIHRDAEYNLTDNIISANVEKAYIIFVCIVLFILTFDVLFFFDKCKEETKYIICDCCCCCLDHSVSQSTFRGTEVDENSQQE